MLTPLLSRQLLARNAVAPMAAQRRILQASSAFLLAPPSARLLRTTARSRAANPQAGKPTSGSFAQAAKNAKEEIGQIKSSIESAVAGSAGSGSDNSGKDSEPASGTSELLGDVKSISGEMFQAVPRPALLWGAAGVLPYISTAGASIYLARQTNLVANGLDSHIDYDTAAALLLHAQNVQISYGAIILSFLGAIHWGFEFAKYGGAIGNRRYLLGVAPMAAAWPTLALAPEMALIAQFAAYTATWFIDLKSTTAGWAPKWYSSYRFWLTAAVGTSIIATLAGTAYYDVDQARSSRRGAGEKLKDLVSEQAKDKTAIAKKTARGITGGKVVQTNVGGEVEATPNEEGDSYVKVANPARKKREEEEQRKAEEEKKKKEAEEQKKKDAEMKSKAKEQGGEDKAKEEGEGEDEKEDDK